MLLEIREGGVGMVVALDTLGILVGQGSIGYHGLCFVVAPEPVVPQKYLPHAVHEFVGTILKVFLLPKHG